MTVPDRRRAPRWLKLVNPINRFLLRRGVGPPPQRLLSVVGRRSGQLRTTPVALVTVAGERYVVAGFAGSDWVGNARAAGTGTLRRGRQSEAVRLIEVPVAQRGPILEVFAREVRGGRSFLTVPPDAAPTAFAAAGPAHPVFRITPVAAG